MYISTFNFIYIFYAKIFIIIYLSIYPLKSVLFSSATTAMLYLLNQSIFNGMHFIVDLIVQLYI